MKKKIWISVVILSLLLSVSFPGTALHAKETTPASVQMETMAKKKTFSSAWAKTL